MPKAASIMGFPWLRGIGIFERLRKRRDWILLLELLEETIRSSLCKLARQAPW